MFSRLFSRPRQRGVATAYERIVVQARRPAFYAVAEVPDTVDGRFGMIALHAFLVMHRLRGCGPQADAFAQALFDRMFADMDQSLREMGAGDLSVGKRVKEMAEAFYGATVAYQRGLGTDDGGASLRGALDRNLYGTVEVNPAALAHMADYMQRAAATLASVAVDDVLSGNVPFPDPPAAPDGDTPNPDGC